MILSREQIDSYIELWNKREEPEDLTLSLAETARAYHDLCDTINSTIAQKSSCIMRDPLLKEL